MLNRTQVLCHLVLHTRQPKYGLVLCLLTEDLGPPHLSIRVIVGEKEPLVTGPAIDFQGDDASVTSVWSLAVTP